MLTLKSHMYSVITSNNIMLRTWTLIRIIRVFVDKPFWKSPINSFITYPCNIYRSVVNHENVCKLCLRMSMVRTGKIGRKASLFRDRVSCALYYYTPISLTVSMFEREGVNAALA